MGRKILMVKIYTLYSNVTNQISWNDQIQCWVRCKSHEFPNVLWWILNHSYSLKGFSKSHLGQRHVRFPNFFGLRIHFLVRKWRPKFLHCGALLLKPVKCEAMYISMSILIRQAVCVRGKCTVRYIHLNYNYLISQRPDVHVRWPKSGTTLSPPTGGGENSNLETKLTSRDDSER